MQVWKHGRLFDSDGLRIRIFCVETLVGIIKYCTCTGICVAHAAVCVKIYCIFRVANAVGVCFVIAESAVADIDAVVFLTAGAA